jgi:hypothetical protein
VEATHVRTPPEQGSLRTKRFVGERVRILKNHHPALKYDLINLMSGGKVGVVEEVGWGFAAVRVGRWVFGCDPRYLRAA